MQLEHQRLRRVRQLWRTGGAHPELLLQALRLRRVGPQFHPRQHAGGAHRQVDALDVRRQLDRCAFQADRKVAVGMVGKAALIDIGQRLAPAVEELHRVVAIDDLRHADQGAAALVHRQPGFGVGNVQVGIGPVHGARFAVHQLVPGHAFLEVQLLLAQYQEPAEQVDVGVADVLVREGRPRREVGDRHGRCLPGGRKTGHCKEASGERQSR
ncbi:hypothetical protein D3C72_1649700 [compost metagenome]